MRNPNLLIYIAAAIDLNIKTSIIDKDLVLFRFEDYSWYIYKASLPINSDASARIASSKTKTSRLLSRNEIIVPDYIETGESTSKDDVFTILGRDIVIKPDNGLGGKGITIKPHFDEFDLAITKAKKNCSKVIIEKYITGKHLRVLVLKGQVIACAERFSASITGDGENSIAKLIEIHNRNSVNHKAGIIELDSESLRILRKKSLNKVYIPKKNEIINIRENVNVSTGGLTRNITNEVSLSIKDLAIKATKVLGLNFAGVDVIIPDFTKEISQSNIAYINDINHNPGLRTHHYPTYGEPIDVAKLILQEILKRVEQSTTP